MTLLQSAVDTSVTDHMTLLQSAVDTSVTDHMTLLQSAVDTSVTDHMTLLQSAVDTSVTDMIFSCRDLAHVWTVVVSLSLFPALAATSPNDDCQFLQSTVQITRKVTVIKHGYPVNIYCTGDVLLNKCEGSCESSVSPSVTTHPGFKKNCRCCKETSTTTKEISLPECRSNGRLIPDYQYKILVKEITGCQCQACTG
ncbi:hypothetical protein Btru_001152 [Bulinus truncatus]|nr:hypothetical protein Btru_001152 [Bulinus truncatus]